MSFNTTKSAKHVSVLIAHFNGAKFIEEQISSIDAQVGVRCNLLIGDDGSNSKDLDTLKTSIEKIKWPSKIFVNSKQLGVFENFLNLLKASENHSEYFAFSDQDDVWFDDKLSRAVSRLSDIPKNTPALYCSATKVVDENLRFIGRSLKLSKPPSFKNALTQNIAAGNTIVINRKAREIILHNTHILHLRSFDWWMYMVVAGAGGQIVFDPKPSLLYRQHTSNDMGAGLNWKSQFTRIIKVIVGSYKSLLDDYFVALEKVELKPENMQIFVDAKKMKSKNPLDRVAGYISSGVYRQTTMQNCKLIATILFGRY